MQLFVLLFFITIFSTRSDAENLSTSSVVPALSNAIEHNQDEDSFFKTQTIENIIIRNAWIRATNGKNAAAFMVFENPEEDYLLKAETDVADIVELHSHIHEGDVVRMRAVDSLTIKGTVFLKPGGLHIMLIDLHHPLREGDTIPLKLMFKKSGTVVIDVPVFLRSPYKTDKVQH